MAATVSNPPVSHSNPSLVVSFVALVCLSLPYVWVIVVGTAKDTEPDLPPDLQPPMDPQQRVSDFRMCRWDSLESSKGDFVFGPGAGNACVYAWWG